MTTTHIDPPLTPTFLIAAAKVAASQTPQALARDAESGKESRWDARRSLDFIRAAGYWSHCRLEVECSSWPLVKADSLEELEAAASAVNVLHEYVAPGAIVLVADRRRGPRRSRYLQCGVVVMVHDRTRVPHRRAYSATVVWAVRTADGMTRPIMTRCTLDAARGDRFIHWWKIPEQRTKLRAAA